MVSRPKPFFWVLVLLAAAGVCAYGFYRAGTASTARRPATGSPEVVATEGTVDVLFLSSSAKKTWIDQMVAQFNTSGKRVGRKAVRVKVIHGNSGEQLDQLKAGKIQPDLWSPGDESWLELAAAHWRNTRSGRLFESYEPLVNIPLVITMWEPMARALGHPEKPLGWLDIAELASAPGGWADYGHPEWGKFRWGHAHPDANSGFLAIVSEIYAILGTTGGITAPDLRAPDVIRFLQEFEGAVVHYGLSNSWIDDQMHNKGPSYLAGAVQYENTIIESNQKHGNRPFKLVAIYPREGNFWTRHPTAILTERWVTPERRAAAQAFLAFLLGRDAQTTAMQLGLRPIRADLPLTSPFDDEHGVRIAVNTSRAFQVPAQDVLQEIRSLWEEVKAPATVVLMLDRSDGMKQTSMESAKRGATEFIRALRPRDQISVLVYNREITELVPLAAVSEVSERAVAMVQGVVAGGNSALYDAAFNSYRTLQDLQRAGSARRYCAILLAGGPDTASRLSRTELLDALPVGEDYDVPKLYTIAYGPDADQDLLAEISDRTNARSFASSAEEIVGTYRELSTDF